MSAHHVEQSQLLRRSSVRGSASRKNKPAEVRARCRDILKHPPGCPSVKNHEAKSRRNLRVLKSMKQRRAGDSGTDLLSGN